MSAGFMIKKVRDLSPGDIFRHGAHTLVATDEWSDGYIWATLPKFYSYIGAYDYTTAGIEKIDGELLVDVIGNIEEENMIYAKFVYPDAGMNYDVQHTQDIGLAFGSLYAVDRIAIHGFHTDVWLKGFDESFNSVQFEFVDGLGEPVDIFTHPRSIHMYEGGD